MSSTQYLDDHGPLRAAAGPVRVFDDVAATPWTPAPRWWNHPVAVLVGTMTAAPFLTITPGLPPMAGFVLAVTGIALTAGSAGSRWWWMLSRDDAPAEAAWVAGQSGCTLSIAQEPLCWTGRGVHGTALLDAHRGEWRLSLHDGPVPDP